MGSALIFLAGVAGVGYGWWALQPVSSRTVGFERFVIPKGQAGGVIASRLAEEGYIRNPHIFQLYLKLQGLEEKLQAGSFELSPSSSAAEIATRLTSGTDDVWVTLPEGWRNEEVAESLARQQLPLFDETAFLDLAAASEGKLFPDTYLVPREADAEFLYYLFARTFEKKVTKGLATEIAASPHSLEDALIMASLLEREATGYEQMRHVAGILWHRIELGMPLQVDATLQYAKGYDQTQQSWWVPPLGADRQLDSPFNTYQHPGLPPRAIANPGLDAIKAALNPLAVDDLFYIHDRNGQLHFAQTLDEHNANVQKYLRD